VPSKLNSRPEGEAVVEEELAWQLVEQERAQAVTLVAIAVAKLAVQAIGARDPRQTTEQPLGECPTFKVEFAVQ